MLLPHISSWTRSHRFEWTNWTFGIWWGTIGKNYYRAIDLGPLQVKWKKVK